MKYIFLLLFQFFIFHLKTKRCNDNYQIFISNILINNVNFLFDKDNYLYELKLNEHSTEISISPLLNIWENYIYKKNSLEYGIFFNENTLEYLDNNEIIKSEELYLKQYYIYIDKKKVNFYDLPYSISLKENEEKAITIFYEKFKKYKFKIKNNKKSSYFYLNDINLINDSSNKHLILDEEFRYNIYFYNAHIEENVKKIKVKGKCHDSQMYVNNNLVFDNFIFSLNENTYNNVLIIECRKYEYFNDFIYKKSNNILENFFKKNWHSKIIYNESNYYTIYKEKKILKNFLNKVKNNYKKIFDNEKIHKNKEINKKNSQYPIQNKILSYNVKNNNNEKNISKIKKVLRKFYFFNIFYNISIKIPNYLYNLIDGNICFLNHNKNIETPSEYICDTFHNKATLYSEISNKLFAFVKVSNQNKIYRIIDKVLNNTINFSSNIYLFLETYNDKKIFKIKLKKDNTLYLYFIIFLLIFLFIVNILIFFYKFCINKRIL
ncbi:conserved Plasmodium protein, unknown function [Plasmodium gallinaceum]|uniref:Uncharacterized protein n=1 Tax=Plasmodium gallinaceum TaxID=5849 RepID=A0A1J1H032_PLAGA|nr:conserved Plasmodium protein, unknown function [Plasmodium gallinaceum]CRG97802.1 conserved Plasmodium protein, unknown function [Plasmodium gallinaceum]